MGIGVVVVAGKVLGGDGVRCRDDLERTENGVFKRRKVKTCHIP